MPRKDDLVSGNPNQDPGASKNTTGKDAANNVQKATTNSSGQNTELPPVVPTSKKALRKEKQRERAKTLTKTDDQRKGNAGAAAEASGAETPGASNTVQVVEKKETTGLSGTSETTGPIEGERPE